MFSKHVSEAQPWRTRALFLGLAIALGGCSKEPIKILDPNESEGGDFGRADLLAAINEFRKTPISSEAFQVLAARIAELRPVFDKESTVLADRMLTFLAIGPLAAHSGDTRETQMSVLASTVWPTALGPAAEPGEDGQKYLERVCAGELASECKFIVPEYWPLFIGAKVWRRLRFAAQEAFAVCRSCQADETYRAALRRYDELSFPIETMAAERSGEGHPREWPRIEKAAAPWLTDVTSLEVSRTGALRLSGLEVSGKEWRDRLRAASGNDDVGLYLRPDISVLRLREFLLDLGTIGFKAARLQVRTGEYPYTLHYFALATAKGRGKSIGVRATDTIQVMALAAEQETTRSGPTTLLSVF